MANRTVSDEQIQQWNAGGGSGLPEVKASDGGRLLGVVEGSWGKVDSIIKVGTVDIGTLDNPSVTFTPSAGRTRGDLQVGAYSVCRPIIEVKQNGMTIADGVSPSCILYKAYAPTGALFDFSFLVDERLYDEDGLMRCVMVLGLYNASEDKIKVRGLSLDFLPKLSDEDMGKVLTAFNYKWEAREIE